MPPVLLVRDASGRATYLLLVGEQGESVNSRVLSLVAEPVEITGEVFRHDDWLVIQADPTAYRRLD